MRFATIEQSGVRTLINMELSAAGLIVAALLLLLGRGLGAPVLIGLFAALPFQSTAFATLPALGGSSPPVATLFALLLLATAIMRRGSTLELRAVLAEQPVPWIMAGLAAYVLIGAYLLPRIFAGQTGAFIVFGPAVYEVPLSPVSGNVSQSGYFLLNTLAFIALLMTLRRPAMWPLAVRGMLALVIVHAAAGLIQLAGNIAGMADVLLPIRTANYAIQAEHQIGSLWRIAGACAEASAFSGLAAASFAFCVSYWRSTGSRTALVFGFVHFVMLVLSTSTTGYVGLGVCLVAFGASLIASVVGGKPPRRDMQLLGVAALGVVLALAAILFVPAIVETLTEVIDAMVFKKHLSASAEERGYHNIQSLRSVLDTYGIGIGLGSSRASSWAIAVLSQTGVVGAMGFAVLLGLVWRAPSQTAPTARLSNGVRVIDVAYAMRAATMASVLTLCISGTTVEPGLLVFAGMAMAASAPSLAQRMTTGAVVKPATLQRQRPRPRRTDRRPIATALARPH